MKRFKNLSLKKKRTLAIAGVSLLGLTIVGTIAYNQDSMFFANLFRLPSDVVEFSETFDSPDDWQPCQEIPKTAIATNKNATPRYVRMKINEYWRTKDTQTPTTDHETSDLPLTWDDNGTTKHYAVINTQNDDKWELKNDGWYYYKTTIGQNESTDSLLKSVTFNCEVNTVGEVRYTAGGTVGEDVPSDYAEANYHLYITFQVSDEEWPEPRHAINCDNPDELYDIIACQTLGPDTGTTFGWEATADATRAGVNTYAPSKDDEYPIFYYRSNTYYNYVDFAGMCWQVLRTTSTGGVKLIYTGVLSDYNGGKVCNTAPATMMPFSTDYQDEIRGVSGEAFVKYAGYMYGDTNNVDNQNEDPSFVTQFYDDFYARYQQDPSLEGIRFSNDVSWDGEKYTLSGDIIKVRYWQDGVAGAPANEPYWKDIMQGHRYTCRTEAESCTEVEYMSTVSSITKRSHTITFKNGDKIEDYLGQIYANSHDSSIKAFVDTWYENNLAAYSDKLEDTVFCADRQVAYGGLAGKDYMQQDTSSWPYGLDRATFSSYMRNYYNTSNAQPTLSCRKEDSFTVSSNIGNGALQYPIALASLDEVTLLVNGRESAVIPFNNYWTMTPGFAVTDGVSNTWGMVGWGSGYGTSSLATTNAVLPVISLKPGTKVVSGDGYNIGSPYKIAE